MDKLSALGFSAGDCARALGECGGRLDDAALWLTQNAQPTPAPTVTQANKGEDGRDNEQFMLNEMVKFKFLQN